MPRMLVHDTRKMGFHCGTGSRCRTSRLRRRGSQVPIGTQARRTTIATALTTSPARSTSPMVPAGTPCTSAPNWTPRSRKIIALRRKTSRSQTARACTRDIGATAMDRCWRTYNPPATHASTAETCIVSAATQATYGPTSVSSVSASASLVHFAARMMSHPTSRPMSAPTPASMKKRTIDSPQLNSPVTAAATAVR